MSRREGLLLAYGTDEVIADERERERESERDPGTPGTMAVSMVTALFLGGGSKVTVVGFSCLGGELLPELEIVSPPELHTANGSLSISLSLCLSLSFSLCLSLSLSPPYFFISLSLSLSL